MATDLTTPETPTDMPAEPRPAQGKSLPLPNHNACAKCGYVLDGLPTSLCPECGLEVQPPPLSLTERTATGFAFMAAQMIITRALGIVSNLLLAWLLLPSDFGLIAMATGIVTFAQVIQAVGVRELLIRRQSSYRHLANAAFWISFLLGLLCAAGIALASPLAARFFNEPRVIGLLLVIAASIPITNASIVPEAKLQIDMRFRWVAMLNMITTGGTLTLTVVLAALDYGAYSFVLPRLIFAIVRTALAWRVAGFTPRLNMQTRRWRFIVGASFWVLLTNICLAVLLQSDVVMLGRVATSAEVGLYGFAFALSLQAVVLIAFSLGQILLPALSKLQDDPKRQATALMRAMHVLAMLVIPTCVLQAAVADPLVRLIFPDKWVGAIPVLQVLSLGMALRFFGIATNALFQAQGRFRDQFVTTLCAMVFFLAVVTPVIFITRDIVATAIAVSVCLGITEPLSLCIALRPTGRGIRDVLGVTLPPLLIAVIACGAGLWLVHLIPTPPFALPGRFVHLWSIAVICAVAGPLILIGSRAFMRPSWDEAVERLLPMLLKLVGGSRILPARFASRPTAST